MKTSNHVIFGSAAVLALGVFMAGCDDGGMDGGSTGGDSGTGTGGKNGTGGKGCPEHELVTRVADGVCEISAGTTTDDLTLTAGNEYLLGGQGGIFIGDEDGNAVLTIEAGVTVFGGDKTFLVIQRGSKIMAQGTATAPITFTSAVEIGSRAAGDWGGLILNGQATTNNGTDVQGEAGSGIYGGTDDSDDSGVLKYVRVQFAGNLVDDQNELNGVAFQGVGSGTTVDYLHIHAASDDGVEFFGGTVNVKHLLVTNASDDSVDWTGGWRGKAQFVAVHQWDGEGDRGIEADNNGDNNTAVPYSNPTISNATFWSNQSTESTGALFREGTKGRFWNFAIGNFPNGCVALDQSATVDNAEADELAMAHARINCMTSFLDGDDVTAGDTEAFFNGGTDNQEVGDLGLTDPGNEGAPDMTPATGSPLLGAGAVPSDSFFEDVDYVGAFAEGDNWAAGWTEFPEN